jgi:hypothetical protein
MDIFVVMAFVGEAVNQEGVAVEVENYRTIDGKEIVEVTVWEAVGVFGGKGKAE